jgi:hypothetical protein
MEKAAAREDSRLFFACGPRVKLKRGNGRYCYHHCYHLQHQHYVQQLHLRLTAYYYFTHQLPTTRFLLRTAYQILKLHFSAIATATIYNQELQLPTTTSSTTATTTINHSPPRLLHNTFTYLYNYCSTTTTHYYHQLLQLPLLRNWMKRCAWNASKHFSQKGVPSSIDVMCRASEVTLQILDTRTNKSILKAGAPS